MRRTLLLNDSVLGTDVDRGVCGVDRIVPHSTSADGVVVVRGLQSSSPGTVIVGARRHVVGDGLVPDFRGFRPTDASESVVRALAHTAFGKQEEHVIVGPG